MLKRAALVLGTLSVLTTMLVGLAGAADAGTAAPRPDATHIVAVQDGLDAAALAGSYGIAVEDVWDSVVTGFSAALSNKQVKALQKDSRVDSVTVNSSFEFAAYGEPQVIGPAVERIDGPRSRTARINGRVDVDVDADIAIIDSGVDQSHPDLNIAGGVDCARAGTWADEDGHGTWTSGVAAARDNTIGAAGVAPGARIWMIRVGDKKGRISFSYIICALEWVVEHADVIEVANMSITGEGQDTANCGRQASSNGKVRVVDALHAAICATVEAGVPITISAGNASVDASLRIPAAYDEVVTVSAYTDFDGRSGGLAGTRTVTCDGEPFYDETDDTLAFFSNFGPDVDIAAPGVCVRGTFIGGYVEWSGTSGSAPMVAAAAALHLVNNPGATPAQVKAALLASRETGPIPDDPDGLNEGLLNVAGF